MDTREVKLYIVMLTYNQKDYVDEAIRSVLKQKTNFRYKLVIGDDCSTDGTLEICRKWRDRYPEYVELYESFMNFGIGHNFLSTYERCWRPYIAICEGDDFWIDRYKLQRQVEFLDSHPEYVCCFHRVVNYYEEDNTKSLSNGWQKRSTDILDLARSNYISNVSAVFRFIHPAELPDWLLRSDIYDYPLHLINAQRGRMYFMNRPMAVYRQHKKAVWSRTAADKKVEIALNVREKLIEYFETKRPDVAALLRESCERIRQNHANASTRKPTLMQRLKRPLSAVRAWVSKAIPLPRI